MIDPTTGALTGEPQRLVLLAEDNDINQRVFQRQLARFGVMADVARDGRVALELWQAGEYAMLFTDLNMRNLDGFHLAAAIRSKEDGFRRIPIVGLTGHASETVMARCFAAGMNQCLSKPVTLMTLESVLKRWMIAVPEHARPPAVRPGLAAEIWPIDIGVLEALVGDDPQFVKSFLTDFIDSAKLIESDIATAVSETNLVRMRASAHQLIATAHSIGALNLGRVCEDIEHTCVRREIALLPALLSRLSAEIRAIRHHIEVKIFLRGR